MWFVRRFAGLELARTVIGLLSVRYLVHAIRELDGRVAVVIRGTGYFGPTLGQLSGRVQPELGRQRAVAGWPLVGSKTIGEEELVL